MSFLTYRYIIVSFILASVITFFIATPTSAREFPRLALTIANGPIVTRMGQPIRVEVNFSNLSSFSVQNIGINCSVFGMNFINWQATTDRGPFTRLYPYNGLFWGMSYDATHGFTIDHTQLDSGQKSHVSFLVKAVPTDTSLRSRTVTCSIGFLSTISNGWSYNAYGSPITVPVTLT